jgi:RHS repeat-associated protein
MQSLHQNPLGNTTTTITNSFGDVISRQEPNQVGTSYKTQYEYDQRRLLTKVIDAYNNSTVYSYDNNGNKTSVTDANTNTSTFTYDGSNLLKSFTNPLNQVTNYSYDVNGNLSLLQQASGDKLEYEYTLLNQLKTIKENGQNIWGYTYDNNGNLNTVTDYRSNQTKTYTYDANDNVQSIKQGNHTLTYGYDTTNNVTSLEVLVGTQKFLLGYEWDQAHQLTKMTRERANLITFQYHPTGLFDTLTYENGMVSKYQYDAAKRLEVLSFKKGDQTIDSWQYTYDKNGNIKSKSFSKGTTSYDYDWLNQLTRETLTDGTVIDYEYDKVGNRTKKTVTKDGNATITTYGHNKGNQMTSVNGTAVTYDVNGNRTKDDRYQYVWDTFGQLKEIKDLSGQTISKYTYDEDGKRISSTVNGVTTYFYYDGNHVIYETDANGNIIVEYTWGPTGEPVSMTKNGTTYYYQTNDRGDVIKLTDSQGNVVADYEYDAWGNIIAQSGSLAETNPYRYAGYRYDGNTKLYYLLARYYNPDQGVFLSRDPISGDLFEPSNQNGYNYANNNPVMYVDPEGTKAKVFKKLADTLVEVGKKLIEMIEKAIKEMKKDMNKKNHILQKKHAWNKVVKNPNDWNAVSNVIKKVLSEGKEERYKGVYAKKLKVNGYTVMVTYNKVNGKIKVSDAWVVTR